MSPLTPPFTPAYYSSYFISNCPLSSRTVTTQQNKPSYTVYNNSPPLHINFPWPFVNSNNPCSAQKCPVIEHSQLRHSKHRLLAAVVKVSAIPSNLYCPVHYPGMDSIMGYSKKEQVDILRTYPPRFSCKRVCQNDSEEDGARSEDSPAKQMHRLV